MPLCLLEEKVRCTLRSGVAITSVARCVGELVENAIDAGAKCIAVRVDFSKYKIKVIDNGEGVSRKDFDLIGQRYVTSKCHTLSDLENKLWHLGYRGEALASIIDTTGTVEIISRHQLSQRTYSKLFYHGRPTSITLNSTPRASVGSTISLHDLFYNLPVRRRAISAVLEMENIRQAIQCLSLANPSVSFSLRNDALGECVMQTRKTNSLMGNFSALFGADKANGMREVVLKRGAFSITGILSIESHYSKLLQFIFINGRVVKKTTLHSCINNIVANSLIACNLSRQADPSKWHDQDNSPKRAAERHAVYVLMIGCPRAEYDICFDPAKTLIEFRDWEAVLDLLAKLVHGFLCQHSLTLGPHCADGKGGREEPLLELPDSQQLDTDAGLLAKPHSKTLSRFQSEVRRISCSTRTQDSTTIGVGEEESTKAVLNGPGPVSESELLHSASGSGGANSGQDTVRQPIVALDRLSMSLMLDKPLRSPLHFQSLPSKLSCLLRDREQREEGQAGDERLRAHCVHSTARSHHPLQIAAAASVPVVPTPPISSSSCNGVVDSNCWDDRESYEMFGYPSSLSRCHVTVSTMLSLHGEAESPDSLERTHESIGTQKGYLFTDVKEVLSQSHVSTSKDRDRLVTVGEECSTSCDRQPVSGLSCNEAAAACDQPAKSSACFDESSRKKTLDISSIKLPCSNKSASSLWKMSYDPVTAKRVFIHKRTGKTSTRNLESQKVTTCSPPVWTHSSHNSNSSNTRAGMFRSDGTLRTESRDSSLCSSGSSHSATYRSPLVASHFLPSAKRLRMNCGSPEADLPAAALDDVGGQGREERTPEPTREGGVFERLLQNWKNPSFLAGQESIASLGSGHRSHIKVHNIIHSYKFSKEMLANVKVLGQVDKKFIACVVDAKGTGDHNLLVLFDQHAVHERVRLELLLKDLHESSSVSGSRLTIKASRVQPPLLLHLTPAEKKLSRLFQRQLEDLGVSLTYAEGGSVGVASLPSVLMEREVSERRRGRPAVALELVQDMIIKHLEVLKSTVGGSQIIPTSLTNILNSQACHRMSSLTLLLFKGFLPSMLVQVVLLPFSQSFSLWTSDTGHLGSRVLRRVHSLYTGEDCAIRFGDVLTVGECEELVESLSKCKLPFQCAHGRPSLVPVLDLHILSKRYPSEAQPSKLCKKLSQLLK